MGLLSMVIMRAPNSTPMVRSCTGWKRLSVNCSSRHDLPTPAAKQSQAGEGRQHHCRKRVRLDLHLAAAAAVAAGCEARGSNRGTEEGSGATGPTGRTCVADDDVLEEVGVRHLRWRRACSSGDEELRGNFAESEDEKKKGVAGCFCLARGEEKMGRRGIT